jgi:group II intron reverse transcriptase/maturase
LQEARERVQALQAKLYRTAKDQPDLRYYSLWDKVTSKDVLIVAWDEVMKNQGAPGVDAQTIGEIVSYGVWRFIEELRMELRRRTYRAQPVRRVYIPKADGKSTRPLGIPTVKDRVVQAAVRLVIEPIFEAGFSDCSYGYRPSRSARDASLAIRKWLNFGLENVLDADIASFFDSIPHDRLMECLQRRIVDGSVLRLIRAWLRAGALENGEVRPTEQGTPQGGVISPLLANIYLDQFDKAFEALGLGRRGTKETKLVRYADDLVILSKQSVDAVRKKVQEILQGLELTLNEEKTRAVMAEEGFDFLGFRFIRRFSKRHGKRITFFFPTPKAEKRARETIRALVGRHMFYVKPPEVIEGLNRFLIGWTNYYRHTNSAKAFRRLQMYCNSKVRRYLRQRKAKKGYGWNDYPDDYLHEILGLERIASGRLVRVWT